MNQVKDVVGMLYVGRQQETVVVSPTPYTLHPAPYTLHPTPYTLHQRSCGSHGSHGIASNLWYFIHVRGLQYLQGTPLELFSLRRAHPRPGPHILAAVNP
jgi:hypothetical protein